MDRVGLVFGNGQAFGQTFCAELGLHKDDDRACALFKLGEKLAIFVTVCRLDKLLFDVGNRRCGRADRDAFRLAHIFARKLYDVRRQGCREQQGLTILGYVRQDLVDLDPKAHIEHAIRFVQNQEVCVVQLQCAARQMVIDASGGADNQTRILRKLFELLWHRLAADQKGCVDLIRKHRHQSRAYLRGKFARRRHDQRCCCRIVHQVNNHRNAESGCLACTCLGRAKNILAF